MNKGYLAIFKGKKVRFRVVDRSPDLKVQFVNYGADYKVKVSNSRSFSDEVIKIQVVDRCPDVKLQRVTSFGDFDAFFE